MSAVRQELSVRSDTRFGAFIAGLADGDFAVLDRIPGALVDAGHAVSALISPDGSVVLHGDV